MAFPSSTDPLLSALAAFPQPLLLTEKDVAALLRCSTRLLQQWRADGVAPPTWVALGPKLIRYSAAALIEWIDHGMGTSKPQKSSVAATIAPGGDGLFAPDWAAAGFNEPPFRGGRRPKVRHVSLIGFLSTGLPDDEWLFVLKQPTGRPLDFVQSLGQDRCDDEEVAWLRLDEFLASTASAAQHAATKALHDQVDLLTPPPLSTGRRRGRL